MNWDDLGKEGATENNCADNDELDLDNTVGTNVVFDNSLEIELARKKAYELLPKQRGELTKEFKFNESEARYVFHKMNKSISKKEGSSTIEVLNALGSLSRSLCVWFFILALLYFVDAFFKWNNNEAFTIPYPTTPDFGWQVLQIMIVIAGLIVLSVIMYIRAERYRRHSLRTIVRLYAYYDDNKNEKDVESNEGAVH